MFGKYTQLMLRSNGYRFYCNPPLNCSILGKNALITGAANGIGLASVKHLLQLGANKVCMIDIDDKNGECASKTINAEHGRDATCFQKVDVQNHEQFEEAFKKCINWVKKLDIVFNNASILNDHKWEETANINFTGAIRGTKLAFKYMGLDQGGCGGIVVNNSSIHGLNPQTGMPVYAGSKHGIIGFTRSNGTPFWFDKTGVKVVALCPGITETNMISSHHGSDDNLSKVLVKGIEGLPMQQAEKVAESLVTVISKATNGSVWVAEGGENPYELEIPERTTLKRKSS